MQGVGLRRHTAMERTRLHAGSNNQEREGGPDREAASARRESLFVVAE